MRHWTHRILTCGVAASLWLFAGASTARASSLLGPVLPYTGFSDSPFSSMSFSWFDLFKMTDLSPGALTTLPGVTISGSAQEVIAPGFEVDSVDGGNAGQSLFSDC